MGFGFDLAIMLQYNFIVKTASCSDIEELILYEIQYSSVNVIDK
jgi:hypothetical protein